MVKQYVSIVLSLVDANVNGLSAEAVHGSCVYVHEQCREELGVECAPLPDMITACWLYFSLCARLAACIQLCVLCMHACKHVVAKRKLVHYTC